MTKLGGTWPQWGRVSHLTILHRQLANLGVKFFDLAVLVLSLFDLVGETPAMPSIACRFHVLTCVGFSYRLAAIS